MGLILIVRASELTKLSVRLRFCGFDEVLYYLLHFAADNGLNPFWDEKFSITIHNPELALIRFGVADVDGVGDTYFLGSAVYPVITKGGVEHF